MTRRHRLLAISEKESKIIIKDKRTICTAIDTSKYPEFRNNIFDPQEFKRQKR